MNPLKAPVGTVRRRLEAAGMRLEPVPWCPDGWFYDGRDLTGVPEHGLGLVYGQDAASMVPALALDPRPGERVLDLCAAPGSKTGHLAARMENRGAIVANDVSSGRLYVCAANLQRLAVANAVLTREDGRNHRFSGILFDRVLLDAPCTGLSSAERLAKARLSVAREVEAAARLQSALLANAARLVRPGGRVVYSTCTLPPEENELVVGTAIASGILEPDEPAPRIADSRPLPDGGREVERCALRLAPGVHRTEAFFVATLRRPAG